MICDGRALLVMLAMGCGQAPGVDAGLDAAVAAVDAPSEEPSLTRPPVQRLCGMPVDDIRADFAKVKARMDAAKATQTTLHLYAHSPGSSVEVAKLQQVFAYANELGMPFVTYDDLLRTPKPGFALAFAYDDDFIDEWYGLRSSYAKYGVKLTMFITRYSQMTTAEKAKLKRLAAEGHAIGGHGALHRKATEYVEAKGVQAYLDDEALPNLQALRADGYAARSYAYPHGDHREDLDVALAAHVDAIRAIDSTCWK